MSDKEVRLGRVYFEFYPPVKGMIRVIAIDEATGTEITLAGDASQSENTLMELAKKKLIYVLSKKQGK
ncbi:MAG: hypothetical protein HQ504_09435 [Rhodospirillaceae bacterium]|mgnify:CR=1 FL=1|nr:hypothetical protein [Rhodospirillaceae bacterium]